MLNLLLEVSYVYVDNPSILLDPAIKKKLDSSTHSVSAQVQAYKEDQVLSPYAIYSYLNGLRKNLKTSGMFKRAIVAQKTIMPIGLIVEP